MKRSLIILSSIFALSLAIGLFQGSRIKHVNEAIKRQESRISSPTGRVEGKSVSSRSEAPLAELKRLLSSMDRSALGISKVRDKLVELTTQLSPSEFKEALGEMGKDMLSTDNLGNSFLCKYFEIHPREALAIGLDLLDQIYPDPYWGSYSHLFYMWSRQELAAALAWFKAEESRLPDPLRDKMFREVCSTQAMSEPREAIKFILDRGQIADRALGEKIGNGLVGPQSLKAFFSAMKEVESDPAKASALIPLREGVVSGLGDIFKYQSFESSIALVEEYLSPEEKIAFADSCNKAHKIHDPVKWANWLLTIEPPVSEDGAAEAPQPPIATRMQSWAKENPNAAADWLATMPEGQLKQDTTAAYAEGVRERDPARAAQWAMVLPAGEQRDEIVGKIAVELEKSDPAAAQSLRENLSSSR